MARRILWIAVAGAALAVAAAAALRPETVLEIENTTRGAIVRLPAAEAFSVTYHHSMYDQPVTEEFRVDADRRIVLVAVASPSPAVREYFGLTAAGERHAMERPFSEVVFRVAAGTPQRLRIGNLDRSFLELGYHGDRLVMRASREPALRSLRSRPARASP